MVFLGAQRSRSALADAPEERSPECYPPASESLRIQRDRIRFARNAISADPLHRHKGKSRQPAVQKKDGFAGNDSKTSSTFLEPAIS